MKYDVNVDIYEGPLHLLVELTKLHLLDIFLMKLQALTTQYLGLVKGGAATLNELAEPLPLLGQLIAMKARFLLPQPLPTEEDEDVPISLEELERRLREYEQFKTVAQVLAELHALQHEYFTRTRRVDVPQPAEGEGQAPAAPIEVGIVDLMTAFARVLGKAKAPIYEIEAEAWTVEMKVEELSLLLSVKRQVGFADVFSPEKTRLELVVTFLALLELVRRRVCVAIQERPFSDILIIRREADEPSPAPRGV